MKDGGNIYAAHRQWSQRPPDECFLSLQELHNFCDSYRSRSYTKSAPIHWLCPKAIGDDVKLISSDMSEKEEPLELDFTNFSFKQFCSQVGAPPDYLSTLPSDLVVSNLIYGVAEAESKIFKLLIQKEPDGRSLLRASTSQIYDRVWNSQLTKFLVNINSAYNGRFSPPPSDGERGTGLYASDHDMFALLVDKEKQIDIGKGGDLIRGFMAFNNEVGSGSIGLMTFLVDRICQNHILWGVKEATSFSTRHVGRNATETFHEIFPTVIAIQMLKSTKDEVDKIKSAQLKTLGNNKDQVVSYLFEKRFSSRKIAEQAWDYSDQRDGLNPNSIWGSVQGLTAVARDIPFYDKRVLVEKNAARLLEAA